MKQLLRHLFFISFLSLFSLSSLLAPVISQAQEQFDYNYIISDRDLTDANSWNLDQIQAFLIAKKSVLANYFDSITGLRASQIIYQSAQDFQINPKFLIALIQKEQSLVEHPSPQPSQFDWATGYAVCDGCSTNDPALEKFKGFYNQVYNAAKRIRTSYLFDLETSGMTLSGFGPGITKLVNGIPVKPVNNATAAVYTYTPHLHGNRLLAQIWRRFFSQSYPDGSLVKVDNEPDIWLIENGLRRRFVNQSVYLSRYSDFSRVLNVSRQDLLKYSEGREIRFANYSYLRTPRGTVYLLVDDVLRGFASAEALRKLGVNPEEIIDVQAEDIMEYEEGKPITTASLFPLGALLQDKNSGGVYWIRDGIKYPIWSREIMTANFPNRKIITVTSTELEKFATGQPVTFRDGELVKSSDESTVYLISNGQRRPFVSAEDFENLGFSWQNIRVTSSTVLALHEIGEPIMINF